MEIKTNGRTNANVFTSKEEGTLEASVTTSFSLSLSFAKKEQNSEGRLNEPDLWKIVCFWGGWLIIAITFIIASQQGQVSWWSSSKALQMPTSNVIQFNMVHKAHTHQIWIISSNEPAGTCLIVSPNRGQVVIVTGDIIVDGMALYDDNAGTGLLVKFVYGVHKVCGPWGFYIQFNVPRSLMAHEVSADISYMMYKSGCGTRCQIVKKVTVV